MTTRIFRPVTQAAFAALCIGLGSAALAQGKVDFSGTWVPVTAPAGKGEAVEVVVVTQDRTGMTASFSAEGEKTSEVIRYEFGATKIQGSPAAPGMEVTVTTSWKGDALVAVNTVKVQERSRSFEQTWSLDPSGRLVITVTRPSDTGPKITTTTYKRKSPAGVSF